MLNRRTFLAATAIGATAISSRISQAVDPGRRIKAGFLGGSHSHAAEKWRLVGLSPEFELVGMAEKSAAVRAGYESRGAKFLAEEALAAACDVVFVESDVADHARHARIALGAGKHAHVEKPPTDNLAEMEELVRLAERNRCLMQVGYMWRHHPGFDAIFEAARKGWLGEIYLVRGMIGNQLTAERRPEWAEFKGGGLFELGSHLIDALIRLIGEPVSVTPFLRKDGPFPDELKDNNLAVFQFSKATGIILNSNLQPSSGRHRVFEVFGTNGSATLRPIEPPTLEFDLAKAAGPYRAGPQLAPLPKYERYVGDIAALADAIRGKRKLPASLEQEALVQKWLLRACGMG